MLEPVMLGLRLRGYLSDYDRNLIDWLFGETQLAFLLRDGQYLHPEAVPLFPREAFDVPPLHNREAVFTQRLAGSHPGGDSEGLLRAARLSRADQPELIIGCLGCEDSFTRRADDDRFGRLVKRFRDAWERAERIEAALKRRLNTDDQYVIVCRTSGRVIMVSKTAAKRLGQPAETMVGREYSEIAALLTGSMNGNALNIENIRVEDSLLSLVSLQPRTTSSVVPPEAPLADFLVHKMKNKLSAIIAASSHLCDLLPPDSDVAELLSVVSSESSGLDGYLDRLRLLLTAQATPKIESGIMDALKTAVENASEDFDPAPCVEFRGVRTARTAATVPQGLPLLFDAILRSHRITHRNHGVTAIRVGETDSHTQISVFTEWSSDDAGMMPDGRWRNYASCLAETLGVTYYHRKPTDKASVSSIVEITVPQGAERNDR